MRFFVFQPSLWLGVKNLQWHYKVLAFHAKSVNDHNSQQLNPCVAPMKTSFAVSNTRPLRGGNKGFSLVEVTIALGVTAFALVALFGMLPTGLNLFRSSMDTSVKSQIIQELNSEALLADFTDLLQLSKDAPEIRFFDDNGKDVTDLGGQDESIYTAQVKVFVPGAKTFPRDDTPPDGDAAALVRVQVHVARNPSHQDPSTLFPDPPAKMPPGVDVSNIYVAKNK